MISIRSKITGDVKMFGKAAAQLKQPRVLLKQVGVLLMSSAVERLDTVLSSDADAVRTGQLAASVRVDDEGRGSGDTIFDLTDSLAVIGSNLVYAAQVHHGGTIKPKSGKLLAIPIPGKMKRSGLSPRDADPARDVLTFIKSEKGFGGVLVDEEGKLGFGKGVLFKLVPSVTQKARPFLLIDDTDQRLIETVLWPKFVEGKGSDGN